MASMSQLVEDVFTCSLCLEKVREPRTLPCLHTFCRYCLSAYVRQKVKDWVFPCPLCGQDTRPNTKGLSVDQWLDTFPASNFLTQLMRVLEARQAEHACDICRQEQVLVEAIVWCRTCMEALCSDCQRVHKRSRASRDHELFSMDSLVHDPLEKLVGSGAREGAARCLEHQGKTATLVCVACKKLVCETCISLTHAACRRIEQAEKAIPCFRKDVAGAMQHLMTHVQATHNEVKWVEDQLDKLTHSREFVMTAVEDLKRRLLEAVENRSSKLLAELETVYRKQRQDFVARGEKSRELGRILGKTVNFLEHLLAYGTECDMLNNFDNVIQQTRLVDTQIAAFKHGNDDMVMKFTPDKKAIETLLSLTSLGDVKVVKNSGRSPKEQPKEENTKKASRGDTSERAAAVVATARFSPRKLSSLQGSSPRTSFSTTPRTKLVATFSGRTNTDTMRTDLRGIVSLRSGDIIVMDLHFRNKRLKKFSPRGKLISVVDTGECPYGMALIPDMDLVVTHPRSREFVFVAAGGTLQVSGRIKTHKSYYSLASSAASGVLAAVAASPPEPTSIDMISFEGEVLKTISLDRVRFPLQPKDIFLPPSGDVLLLFGAKEALVCLTEDGSVRYSTQQHDMKRPVSLVGDLAGNAYVADTEASKIHAITADGKYRGELLSRKDGVREPLALGVNDQGQILVTQTNGDVKVYNL